jgi:ATP-dependent Clp protease ATP-binding subunit ClpA
MKELFGHRKATASSSEVGPRPQRSFLSPDLGSELLARVQALRARSQPVPNDSDLPISDSARRILTLAAKLRDDLEQTYVEPLHLLAAILEDESSLGAQILRQAGITRDQIFKFIREEPEPEAAKFGERPATAVGFALGPPVYSQKTREALFLARQEARIRGAELIEVADVLVALVIEDQENFLDALSRYPGVGVSLPHMEARPHRHFLTRGLAADLLKGLESLRARSQPLPPATAQTMSAGMKRAFSVAARLRDEMTHAEIEPPHLLAAILEDESSRSAQIFREAGITREKVIQFLREGE